MRLAGLTKASDLNGRSGVVAGFEEAKQRWIVDLGEGLGKKLFKRENLVADGSATSSPRRPPPSSTASSSRGSQLQALSL